MKSAWNVESLSKRKAVFISESHSNLLKTMEDTVLFAYFHIKRQKETIKIV